MPNRWPDMNDTFHVRFPGAAPVHAPGATPFVRNRSVFAPGFDVAGGAGRARRQQMRSCQ